MHDNTWARALIAAGCEATLAPTYTPIRVDEPDQSERRVFYGGLNVYLRSRFPLWRLLPAGATRWLDRPGIIRWATGRSVSNSAAELGPLTLDMLAGERGPHRAAGEELARHIVHELRPDVVIFSNALLVGALAPLRQMFGGPIVCTLQGDDVFLDGLPPEFKDRAIAMIAERAAGFDAFFVHSRFYRDYISQYLRLPVENFRLLPLGIDREGHVGQPGERTGQPFTVGYFARIAPEKGLQHLVTAMRRLHARHPEVCLRIGGYLAPGQQRFLESCLRTAAPLGPQCEYVGSPATREEKVAFLRSVDVLSVPTEFLEPKGLYLLEALANGVPVVQPEHGAFPELIAATGGGLLTRPRDPAALAAALEALRDDPELRRRLGAAGQQAVREQFDARALAAATLDHLQDLLNARRPSAAVDKPPP